MRRDDGAYRGRSDIRFLRLILLGWAAVDTSPCVTGGRNNRRRRDGKYEFVSFVEEKRVAGKH